MDEIKRRTNQEFNIEELRGTNQEMLELTRANEGMRIMMEELERDSVHFGVEQEAQQQLKESHDHILLIGCAVGLVLVVAVIVLLVLYCRSNKVVMVEVDRKEGRERSLSANIEVEEGPDIPGQQGRMHDAVRDRYGMNEIYGVTAKEGADLVRIARPLATEGAARRLSEALMGIKPIIKGKRIMETRTSEGSTSTLIQELRRVQEVKKN